MKSADLITANDAGGEVLEKARAHYLRFGKWPADERSRNHVTGGKEDGVSAWVAKPVWPKTKTLGPAEPVWQAQLPDMDPGDTCRSCLNEPGEVEDCESCGGTGEIDPWDAKEITDPAETYASNYDNFCEGQPAFIVTGDVAGVGHDGEPVLRDLKQRREIQTSNEIIRRTGRDDRTSWQDTPCPGCEACQPGHTDERINERAQRGGVFRKGEPATWAGRPVAAPDHAAELDLVAAQHEFGPTPVPRKQAEELAYAAYLKRQNLEAAVHHLRGMRAAEAIGNHKAAQPHKLMYDIHVRELGHNPAGPVPDEVRTLAGEDGKQSTRFKPHEADVLPLRRSEPLLGLLAKASALEAMSRTAGSSLSKNIPKQMSDADIERYIAGIHTGSRRDLRGMPWGATYELRSVPLDKLPPGRPENQQVRQYAKLSTGTAPPIVVTRKGVPDGHHRIAAARLRGDNHHLAYVDSTLDLGTPI